MRTISSAILTQTCVNTFFPVAHVVVIDFVVVDVVVTVVAAVATRVYDFLVLIFYTECNFFTGIQLLR